jgi:hypothetical protein
MGDFWTQSDSAAGGEASLLFRRHEALQLLHSVLDHHHPGGGLVRRDVLLDHQESLAVGRDIVHAELGLET